MMNEAPYEIMWVLCRTNELSVELSPLITTGTMLACVLPFLSPQICRSTDVVLSLPQCRKGNINALGSRSLTPYAIVILLLIILAACDQDLELRL